VSSGAGGPGTATLDPYEETARAAFEESGYGGTIAEVTELSPMVSTNHVYRLSLVGGGQLVAKVSSYGSYWLFKEDHDRLHRCRQQLQDTRYANLLADTVTKDGRVFVHRDGDLWAALYEEVPKRRSLPRIFSGDDVQNLAEEMARFHQACREVARLVPPTSTSIKSDAIHLLDLMADPATAGRFPYDPGERATIQMHCERFLEQLDALGYDDWVKIPVLIDWNLGNFSVDYHGDRFRLYSRWDYDWFRMDPRTLDFYFLSRVSSRTGDRTVFTYGPHTFVEPRFQLFLAAYHRVYPLRPNEVLFLREVYRFFILNYVIRQGYAFFQPDLAARLQREAVTAYLPAVDELDLQPLLALLD
jgi:Ser/Thr protein kinase RdoA (MazF antagonist)